MSLYAIDPQTIVDFWREAGPDRWFSKDDAFDAEIRNRFGDIYEQAARGELESWRDDATGSLALVILLDQFPRNMFRGTPRAFATDEKALAIAREALARGDAHTVGDDINQFLAVPLMHAEDLAAQEECIEWMNEIGDEKNVAFAKDHRDIIARFGRFPHRNPVLDRETTPEEQAFLNEGGFAG
ncbi:DUF924 family protein [Aurantimonas aggregata]|uniref:DUF924 family protein n=1 Tax=Aurantimonas aggregata TaxID=2047720 RepID=A0A6L9MHR6_9HYPH|nr:DUF924 family protein [Aurantimonas aggregata]NDV87384.1 DUF924 family protein [Aurantimonas aggregata]